MVISSSILQNSSAAFNLTSPKQSTTAVKKATTSSANLDTFTKSSFTAEKANTYSAAAITKASGMSTAKNVRNIPSLLAAKRAGVRISSNESIIVNSGYEAQSLQNEMNKIRNVSTKLSYKSSYCYSQTGNNYGYTNATSSCATYALATAISIRDGKATTPKQISTNSSKDGHGTLWANHGATTIACSSESEAFLGIDAQLSLGNPVIIHAIGKTSSGANSEHWATVIGKKNGTYTIIDPYYGNECSLSEMQIYKNSGKITGYAIVSNKY